MEVELNLEEMSTLALKKGALDAILIKAKEIVVADWTYWKCRFGCPSYGKFLACPPYSPNPQQTRSLLKDYEYALLIKFDSTFGYHNILLELEREAFLGGFYKAFGLTAGSCRLCNVCNVSEGRCVNPGKARPSMEACGIDVFATVRSFGFDMKVMTTMEEKYPRICLLLLQ